MKYGLENESNKEYLCCWGANPECSDEDTDYDLYDDEDDE